MLLRAQVIGGLPANLVGSLTGLTEGRFPVAAKASYADEVTKRSLKGKRGNAVQSRSRARRPHTGITIFADAGSPVVAVSDAQGGRGSATSGGSATSSRSRTRTATRTRTGSWPRSPQQYAAPKPQKLDPAEIKTELALPEAGRASRRSRRRTRRRPASRAPRRSWPAGDRADDRGRRHDHRRPAVRAAKERLFAHPTRANAAAAGGAQQEFLRTGRIDGALTPARALGLARDQIVIKRLQGRLAGPGGHGARPHRPRVARQAPVRALRDPPGRPRRPARSTRSRSSTAGSCSSRRRSTARKGKNPFVGPDAATPTIGQILLMSKDDAAAARARRPADPDLRLRPPGHPGRA